MELLVVELLVELKTHNLPLVQILTKLLLIKVLIIVMEVRRDSVE